MNNGKCCCPAPLSAIACGSLGAGVLAMILAIVSRLASFAPLGLGPRSFAAGAALLFLLSIAVHLCKGVCFAPPKS